MATAVEVETKFEDPYTIILEVTAVGDETASEQAVIDVEGKTGPDGLTLARTSLREAEWDLSSTFEYAKLYWHDEGNDEVALTMSGQSSWDGTGFGGNPSPDEVAQAGDQDVLIDLVNATESAGTARVTLVFKKKSD